MLTRCPACAVWFRVRAEHLSAAAGYVTCGECDTVFNALATLVEEAPAPVWAVHAPPASSSRPGITQPAIVAQPATRQMPPLSGGYAAEAVFPAPTEAPGDDLSPPPPSHAGDRDEVTTEPAQEPPQEALERATDEAYSALPDHDHAEPAPAVGEAQAEDDAAASADPWFRVEPAPVEGEALTASAAEQLADSEAGVADLLRRATHVMRDRTEFTTALEPGTDAQQQIESLDRHDARAVDESDELRPSAGDVPASGSDARLAVLSDLASDRHERDSTTPEPDAATSAAEVESYPERAADEAAMDTHARQEPSSENRRLEADEPIPELLRSEIIALERQRQRKPPQGLLWGLGCAALALVFVAQLAYVYRDRLIAQWPSTAPLVARLCAELGCPARDATIASPVELLARDVREHPQYHDALLVNATLVNSSASAAPFPVIELVLHDATGGIIGARRFAPEEYLDHSIAIEAGMPPAQPVYIVIELGGSAAAATSFEFSFM